LTSWNPDIIGVPLIKIEEIIMSDANDITSVSIMLAPWAGHREADYLVTDLCNKLGFSETPKSRKIKDGLIFGTIPVNKTGSLNGFSTIQWWTSKEFHPDEKKEATVFDNYTTTAEQSAKIFRVSSSTVLRWGNQGLLDCIGSNGWVRFNDEEFAWWERELDGYTLNTANVISLSGAPEEVVRKWTDSGMLLYKTLPSGRYRYSLKDVKEFLEFWKVVKN
jgi:hypothetical protein